MSFFVLALSSSLMVLIPPAVPGDPVPDLERQRQYMADLYSPQAKKLMETFFREIGEGDAFDLTSIFTNDASYVDLDGQSQRISENLRDDGRPDISQWSRVASGLLSYDGSRAAIVEMQLQPVGSVEAVLKFYFSRNKSGALRISRIVEIKL